MTPGTLNYYLGDVSNGVATCAGDDHVNMADLSLLGANYGITLPSASPVECLDVGPTTDHSTDGRPLTDNMLEFEDLVIFALNFGAVSNPIVASRAEPAPATGDAERLAVAAPKQSSRARCSRRASSCMPADGSTRCRWRSAGTPRSPSRRTCVRAASSRPRRA